MLYNTFIHIPGIGGKTERKIWEAGIHTWDDWQEQLPPDLSASKKNLINYHLDKYRQQDTGQPEFYAALLPASQYWRLFPHFREKTAYFDIETNGGSRDECEITTISLYDGNKITTYIQGENLDAFVEDIAHYDMIVTYNGKSFDVPVVEAFLHTKLPQVHIDLRHVLYNLGYRGGLKGCEKQLGIYRHELDGIDGFFAVLLWQEYLRSNKKKVLDTLLAYNIADAVNLERLMVHAYNLNISETPFKLSHYIPVPDAPPFPCSADADIITKIKQRLHHYPLAS